MNQLYKDFLQEYRDAIGHFQEYIDDPSSIPRDVECPTHTDRDFVGEASTTIVSLQEKVSQLFKGNLLNEQERKSVNQSMVKFSPILPAIGMETTVLGGVAQKKDLGSQIMKYAQDHDLGGAQTKPSGKIDTSGLDFKLEL